MFQLLFRFAELAFSTMKRGHLTSSIISVNVHLDLDLDLMTQVLLIL